MTLAGRDERRAAVEAALGVAGAGRPSGTEGCEGDEVGHGAGVDRAETGCPQLGQKRTLPDNAWPQLEQKRGAVPAR